MDQTTTDACYRCGYNLTGIADDQPCPECGLLAERSRRGTDELHQTRPRWLRRLSWGVWLILLALLSPVPLLFVAEELEMQLIRTDAWGWTSWGAPVMTHLPAVPLDSLVLLFSVGALLLATREGYPPADRADGRLRLALRLALVGPWAALALLHTALHMQMDRYIRRPDQNTLQWLHLASLSFATLGCMPLPILLAVRLRGLARRVRSAHLAEHCLIVGIGTTLTLAYAYMVLLMMEYAHSWGWGANWANSGTASLLVATVLGTASMLFVLWALYLLIRFAIAFAIAARRLRRQWRRDDRSVYSGPLPQQS